MTPPQDHKTLDRLLAWLAVYALAIVFVAWACGKLADVVPILSNLVSGFAGAAFAIMHVADKHEGGPQ